MDNVKLLADYCKCTTAADGYTRFALSRASIQALLDKVTENPQDAINFLNMCLEVRGVDNRKKKNK